MESWASQHRWWIVSGYALAFVGSVVFAVGEFSGLTHSEISGTVIIDYIINPLISLSSLWAWWWLAQLTITDHHQRRIVRNGLVGLTLALVWECTALINSFVTVASNGDAATWVLVAWGVDAVGTLIAAIGFIAAFFELRTPVAAHVDDEDA